MDFSRALDHLKAGERMARVGWNPQYMWAYLGFTQAGGVACFYAVTKSAARTVVWHPTLDDLLAHDWGRV